MQATAEKPWTVYHCDGNTEAVCETAEEALAQCAEMNADEAPSSRHFYRTDASCDTFRCKGVALTPGGLCAWHERKRLAELIEEAEENWDIEN